MQDLLPAWPDCPRRRDAARHHALAAFAAFAAAGLLLKFGLACSVADPPAPARPNLLLVTVDTLRADRLGAWTPGLTTSPRIDAFAASGVRFADASVQWPKTWPSMASMLTGRLPTQTGVRHAPRRPLPEGNLTLAETLREAGYRTAAVVSNANLGRRFAFDQGFEHFVESWMEEHRRRFGDREFKNRPGLVKHLTDGRAVLDEGLTWLDGLDRGEPFFLWLHFMEPHGPYLPPREHADRFEAIHPPQHVPLRALPPYQIQRGPDGRPETDLAFYKARYDGEIRAFDDALGRLLGELEERGLRDHTLVAFTSDHGESLEEHGYYLEHGALPYQPGVHVPLVLALPDQIPERRVVEEPVGLVDLAPTLLELLELRVPPEMAGRSLLPLIRGEEEEPRPVFFEAGNRKPSQRGVRQGPWKLVHYRSAAEREQRLRPEWELYHLGRDPEELRNVIDRYPERAETMRRALEAYARTTEEPDGTGSDIETEDLAPEVREQLRALGYLEDEEEAEGTR